MVFMLTPVLLLSTLTTLEHGALIAPAALLTYGTANLPGLFTTDSGKQRHLAA